MERHEWEMEHVKERQREQKKELDNHEERIRTLELFKETTIEKLIIIFKRLERLEKRNERISNVFQNSLVTGIIGTFLSFVVWLIQRSWGA